MQEGVIQFQIDHQQKSLSRSSFIESYPILLSWRDLLAKLQLIGEDEMRYQGAGYGNLSMRFSAPSKPRGERCFYITASQTSGLEKISADHLVEVKKYSLTENKIVSAGQYKPSSESLTHGAIYDLSPQIRAVIHVHSPKIWRNASRLKLPISDSQASFGTIAMAYAAQKLYQHSHLPEVQIFAMGGHEDGVIAFGKSLDEAAQRLIQYWTKAIELNYRKYR